MTAVALRPVPRDALSRRRPARWRKRAPGREDLVSVAGAIGSPVLDRSGERVGWIEDLVVQWGSGGDHPVLAGVMVRGRRRRTYATMEEVAALYAGVLRLNGRLMRRPVDRRRGLVALAHEVLDRQVVDADGVDVARISDLILAVGPHAIRLVGADVSARTLLRRLGPASLRRRVAPQRIYDWAAVGPFSASPSSELRLTRAADRLQPT